MDHFSLNQYGEPSKFISFIVISHGEDLPEQVTPPHLNGKLHKLMLSGISGNITNGSEVLDALFYNAARIQAHDRSISHVEKLYRVRDEVFRYPYIHNEIGIQQSVQKKFVAESVANGRYQRVVESAGWIPQPSIVKYNRRYSFNANPWNPSELHTETDEYIGFGIWAVDASITIANKIGLRPGIHSDVVSLMPLLQLVQTSARSSPSPHAPDMSASNTTLFDLVHILQESFGKDTYVSVIDLGCRYYNWDAKKPRAHLTHAVLKMSHSGVDSLVTPCLPGLASCAHSFLDWGLGSDEVPSPPVGHDTVPIIKDYVQPRNTKQVKEVVYWERNGSVKCLGDSTRHVFESDVKYDIAGRLYGLGDTLLAGGRQLRIFYILERAKCFFCHETVNGAEHTVYLTPVVIASKIIGFELTDNLSDKLQFKERVSVKQFNVKTFTDQVHQQSAETPPPFLPPYGYITSRMGSFRIGGRRTRQRTRVRITKHKKYKRRHAKNRKKTRRSNK
jgi:hypothetical protein